jgi:hypothetical protein
MLPVNPVTDLDEKQLNFLCFAVIMAAKKAAISVGAAA